MWWITVPHTFLLKISCLYLFFSHVWELWKFSVDLLKILMMFKWYDIPKINQNNTICHGQSLRGGVVFFPLFSIAVQIQNCMRKSSYAIDQLFDQKMKFEWNMFLINYFKFSSKMSSQRCVKDMIMISQFYFQLKKAKETTQTLLSVLLLSWQLSTEYLSFQVLSTESF